MWEEDEGDRSEQKWRAVVYARIVNCARVSESSVKGTRKEQA